jgi:site-specific DNA-methyltransferase (adenine-specific)
MPERSEPAPAVQLPGLTIFHEDNLDFLRRAADASYELIYIDPPFNTGRSQVRTRVRTEQVADGSGDRTGFGGKRYATTVVGESSFADQFDDYQAFLAQRLEQARRLLTPHGSLFLHLDPRESHYAKVFLDGLFGRACFQNEIIWSYDFGGRSRSRWSGKHDTILWYSRDPKHFTYEFEAIDRIPYMAPALVGAEKAERGKTPTDVWWNTIVSPTGKEKTGYPTQKPLTVLERIVRVHSRPGERVLDFFAGSGTTGVAALRAGRTCTLVDSSAEALRVMRARFEAMAQQDTPST